MSARVRRGGTRPGVALVAGALAVLLGGAGEARAEAYLAVREGYKCNQCHVNMTGGGKRNLFGNIYAQDQLPLWMPAALSAHRQTLLRPAIGESFSVGADLRLRNVTRLRDDVPPSGRVDSNTAFRSEVDFNDFEEDATVYLEGNLFGDEMLTFYLDQRLAPGLVSREAFALLRLAEASLYVKGGKFFHPYGLRLIDRDLKAFIRSETGFNYDRSDLGLELGWEPGPFSLIGAVTEGTGRREPMATATLQAVFRHLRAGGSVSEDFEPDRLVAGPFLAASLGRFTLLAEFDFVNDGRNRRRELVAYGELDFLVFRGLNLRGAFEWHDPSRARPGDSRERVSVGLEFFPLPFTRLGLFYRIQNSVPDKPDDNFDQAVGEVSLFF